MILGVSVRVSLCGQVHPWKIISKSKDQKSTLLIALPGNLQWLNEPIDPVYGSLLTGCEPSAAKKAINILADTIKIYVHANHKKLNIFNGLNINWIDTEIDDNINDQSSAEILSIETHGKVI